QANVGQRILHFSAFIKAEAADQFVADAAAPEDFFKGSRLKIGTVFDGAGLRRIVVEELAQLFADEFSFGLGVARFKVTEIRAAGNFRAQVLAEPLGVILDDGAGRVEDALRGAVVALEADDVCVGEISRKTKKNGNVRAAPAVDRLVFVPDDADVLVRSDEKA